MSDEYVSKEVFAETMKRIEVMFSRDDARYKQAIAEMRKDMNQMEHSLIEDNARQYEKMLSAVVDEISKVKSDLVNMINFRFAFMSTFITVLLILLEFLRH